MSTASSEPPEPGMPHESARPAEPHEPAESQRRAFTDEVLSRLRGAGFALAGVCDARASDHAEAFRAWLRDGRHGEMAYMAEHIEQRIDPGVMVPGARSIICVADRYHDGRRAARDGHAPRGRVARYAQGGDYHEILRSRLEPLAREWRTRFDPHRFRVCVDTAPIMEREHAMRAGLGRIGKHTLLIGEGAGSWLLLGEIVTTWPLLPTRATPAPASADPCGSCTRCIDACPTQAITPWSVDASRCLSAITIEHSGEVDPALERAQGEWLFGCDDCQEVCPHNQPTRRSRRAGAGDAYRPTHRSFDPLELLDWTEADRDAANLSQVLRRATLTMMKRSAIAILGAHLRRHSDDAVVRGRLQRVAEDPREDRLLTRAAMRALDSR